MVALVILILAVRILDRENLRRSRRSCGREKTSRFCWGWSMRTTCWRGRRTWIVCTKPVSCYLSLKWKSSGWIWRGKCFASLYSNKNRREGLSISNQLPDNLSKELFFQSIRSLWNLTKSSAPSSYSQMLLNMNGVCRCWGGWVVLCRINSSLPTAQKGSQFTNCSVF